MTPAEIQDPSLFDAIAELLPAHLREHFYRRMAHLRQLAPNDDILHIAEARKLGIPVVAVVDTNCDPTVVDYVIPGNDDALRAIRLFTTKIADSAAEGVQMVSERAFAAESADIQLLEVSPEHIGEDGEVALDAATAYHHLLDARLQQLPDEIQAGINPDIIAAKLIESLRQQFAQAGLPAFAQEIGIHASTLTAASKQLSSALLQFSDPNTGACHRLQTALSSMYTDLNNAADHVRSVTRTLRQELFTALVVLCLGAGVIGFLLGILCAHSG